MHLHLLLSSSVPDELVDALEGVEAPIHDLVDQVDGPLMKVLIWVGSVLGMLLVGWVVIRILLSLFKRMVRRSKVDDAAIPFLHSVVKAILYILLFITVISATGLVDTASLVAILGVIGLAVSLAIQDSLSNVAGGALLLMNKPFTKDDFVDINDISGTIVQVSLTYTILRTVDNKRINIPNGEVVKAKIVNYSSEPYRRMEVLLTIARDADMDAAEELLLAVLKSHPMTLTDPPCSAKVSGHSDLGTIISCRAWATREDYWVIYFDLQKQLKAALDENGIAMPVRYLPPQS